MTFGPSPALLHATGPKGPVPPLGPKRPIRHLGPQISGLIAAD